MIRERKRLIRRTARPSAAEPLERRVLLAAFAVTSTADGGAGSLRDAIEAANLTAEPDTIVFGIAGDGPFVIRPLTLLPAVTAVTIDATTQPGWSIGRPVVQLDGSVASASSGFVSGFELSDGAVVRGLSIVRWTGRTTAAVRIRGSGNVVEGNWIGFDASGAYAANEYGVAIEAGASGNRVGGASAAARNVVAPAYVGVQIDGDDNVVVGNYVGTNPAGTAAATDGGGDFGVYVTGSRNHVGSEVPGERNVISGNGTGVRVAGAGNGAPAATGNFISGNYIGTTADGTAALGNGVGVTLDGSDGPGAAVRDSSIVANIVSGNTIGVDIVGSDASGNYVDHNVIGLDATAGHPVPNAQEGLLISDGAHHNLIGQDFESVAFNVVSGNGGPGIFVRGGHDNFISSARVENNGGPGILIDEGSARTVVESNVIGGNPHSSGVFVGSGCEDTVVRYNLIGGRGTAGLNMPANPEPNANGLDGVTVGNQALRTAIDQNLIVFNQGAGVLVLPVAGLTSITANTIHTNGLDGVHVFPGSPLATRIVDNAIYSNGSDGVNLFSTGSSPKVAAAVLLRNSIHNNRRRGIGALGPPQSSISTVITNGGVSYVWGSVVGGAPASDYHVELFSNTPDALDDGAPTLDGSVEGQRFEKAIDVRTAANGLATYFAELPAMAPGSPVSATYTGMFDGVYRTSEFVVRPVEGAYDTPRVAQVFVKSSKWTAAFLKNLAATGLGSATYGYAVPPIELRNFPTPDLREIPLPWINIDTVSVAFTEPVLVDRDDLLLVGVNVPGYHRGYFQYDPTPRVGTWALSPAVTKDRAVIRVDGSTAGAVTGLDGEKLHGKPGPGYVEGGYPSGEGDSTAGDFKARVNFLPGDADRAGERVNALDLGYVKARVNRVAGETAAAGATYSAFADVNGDGRINAIDLGAVKARQNDALPEATVGAAGEAVVARGGAVDLLEDTAPIL